MPVPAFAPARREAPPPDLVRMRRVALGLLIGMAALFLLARARVADAGGASLWGYLRALAEASMVGGFADWFAVTALFRHPLGLPIPHTAIIPRNKDRIGDTLATFLKTNFLVPSVVARRMRRLDIAGAIARWLTDPPEAAGGQFRQGAARLTAQILEGLDADRLSELVRSTAGGRLRETEVSPILGQLLGAMIAQGRHRPLIDAAIRWGATALSGSDEMIRQMVHDRAGSLMRWTGLDKTISDRLIAGLAKLLADMADDPDHPLRARAEAGVEKLAVDLREDGAMRARVEAAKEELLANPALQRWLGGLWEQARDLMLRIARDPEAFMRGQLGEFLRAVGEAFRDDRRLAFSVNRFARRAAVGAAAGYGDAIVRLVSETVRGWDARTLTRRLENQVGKDLQFIRVNGTLVGGLVGVLIHAVDVAL